MTVENQGTSDANAKITLLYVPAEGEPGIAAKKTVAIAAGATETVTLSWDTSGTTLGAYTIRARATLVEDSTVADSLDGASTITISAPPPYAVAVTAVEVASATVIQGETVDVEVTVKNLGTSDANAMITLLYVPAEGQPGTAAEKTVAIAAGAAETVTLSWDTADANPGAHTIRAGATLVEDTNVSDYRDAASTITISALTYGVSITAFDVPSGPATQGYVVDADVTVKNLGSVAARFTVTLFDQPSGGTEGTADEETVEIAAGATKTVTLSWDTSDATPGAHTFRAGVTLVDDTNVSDSLDSAAIITISVPPPYAVAVTAVDVPAGPVTRGDTVDVGVTVENQGTSDANAKITLLYVPAEGEPGIAAEKTVAIAAGATGTVTLSWDTSDAALGAHTVRAGVTLVEDTNAADSRDAVSPITIILPPYAVAVTAVDVPAEPVAQGETVDVVVSVENQGTSNAAAMITLLYVPAEGEPGTAAEKTVAIAAGSTETVTLSWDTSDAAPGAYTIRAGATLVEDSNVSDSQDAVSTITISPPPYAVAVTAVDIASATVTKGDTLDVDVTVENRGTSDANAVVTVLYVPTDGQPGIAAAETVAIAAGESETTTLSWNTSEATPGAYTIRASVTLVEDTDVSDSRDALSTITIGTPTYGVVVTSVDVPTGQATQGDTVDILVAIENRSSVAAMFEVTLFYQRAGGQEGIAAKETFKITAGFTKGLTMSWDTSGVTPGVYQVGAKVMLVGVAGVDDSRISETSITIIAPVTYGVSITAIDVPAGPVAQGETVDVDVTIENSSSVAAMFAVTLFYQPAGGQEVTAAEETVEIAAGAIETVTLNWDISDATFGVYTIRAKAILADVAGVDDVADSRISETSITISAPVTYGVAVTAVDVPAGPAALGAEVDVYVTIENLGNTEVTAEVILLYQPDKGQGGTADEETVGVNADASVTITLSWDTSGVTPGAHTMRAGVTLVEDTNAADFRDSTSTITVISGRIILGDDRGLGVPDASFGGKLAAAPVETTPSPVTGILVFGGFAKGYETSSPVIETSLVPHDKLFTTNAQATFGSGLQNPFELGEIRVTVHLEERPNSLGSYVMVGSQIFFADANGNCRIVVPSGVYDLAIQAPGYVSARIPGVRLGIGEAVTVPELTLPFGDSNGDGHIDILDLSIAAGNFGATMHQISLP